MQHRKLNTTQLRPCQHIQLKEAKHCINSLKGNVQHEIKIHTATSSNVMPVSGTSWNLDLLRAKSMGPPIPPIGPPAPPLPPALLYASQSLSARLIQTYKLVQKGGYKHTSLSNRKGDDCAHESAMVGLLLYEDVPEEEEEAAKGNEREEEVAEQGHVVALLVAL